MNKIAFFALLLAVAPSHAVVVVPRQSFAASIARTVHQANFMTVEKQGVTSLTRLCDISVGGDKILAVSNPELLEPLLNTLTMLEVDLANFDSLPTEKRLEILATAAKETEIRLRREARVLVSETNKVGKATFSKLKLAANIARDGALYLNDDALASLRQAEKALFSYDAARKKRLEDLPSKIADGVFDAKDFFKSHKVGSETFYSAQYDPGGEVYKTPLQAFDARVKAWEKMPAGTWGQIEQDYLLKAFNNNNNFINNSDRGSGNSRINSLHRSPMIPTSPRLIKASVAFFQHRMAPRDVQAFEAHFTNSVNDPRLDWVTRARILATIHNGSNTFFDFKSPSWEYLKATKKSLLKKNSLWVKRLIPLEIGGIIVAAITGIVAPHAIWFMAGLMIAILTIPILLIRNLINDQILTSETPGLDELMKDSFKPKAADYADSGFGIA